MSSGTLFDKVWKLHTVQELPFGLYQIFIELHLIHEVTSPQAFDMLREQGLKVLYPKLTFATVDHIMPTGREDRIRPLPVLHVKDQKTGIVKDDNMPELMLEALEENCRQNGITFFGLGNKDQGIVHVIGPELGLTKPGMTIACGDSHTSTHGAFGSIGMGIGTTQVSNILATQCLLLEKPKVRKIVVNGTLHPGVNAKDIILHIIRKLGVEGGINYAYEYSGSAIESLDMEGRMTICNMSIEGGATCGYVNPDQTTFDYLRGRRYVPSGNKFDAMVEEWKTYRSNPDAVWDDVYTIESNTIPPMVTWGINPGQAIGIDECIPTDADPDALSYMGFAPGQQIAGTPVDVAFIGSCTNGRITDLRKAAHILARHHLKAAPNVRALVVPGSESVKRQAEVEGLDQVFTTAGFEWRDPGCSMCLGMNSDQVPAKGLSISSSNRNFKGRQGPGARTVLASVETVVASATSGVISDCRHLII